MSRITLKTTGHSLHDSSTQIIQNSIEVALGMLKEEKKEESLLNKQINSLKSQLLNPLNIKTASEDTENLKKIYNLTSKQVEASFNQINTIQLENKRIKEKIEDLRLESNKYKRIIDGLEHDLSYSSNLVRARSQSKLREMNTEDETKLKLHQFLIKSNTSKESVANKIQNLSANILQDKEHQSSSLKKHSDLMQNQINRPLTALDSKHVISKISSSKAHDLIMLKKKYESHKKHNEILKDGFDNIKNALGIGNYMEIAESFIASEHRMNEIQLYLLKITADIDSLEFSNKSIISTLRTQKKADFLQKCSFIKRVISTELKQAKQVLDVS